MLNDYGVVPALYDDYGHYLFSTPKIMGGDDWNWWGGSEWNDSLTSSPVEDAGPNWKSQLQSRKNLRNLVLADKRLHVASLIDFLVWEDTSQKYRIYISSERLRAYCPPNVFADFKRVVGRMALASVRKTRLSDMINDDYAVVGKNLVFRAAPKERRRDVRMIHRIHAIMEGRSFLNASDSFALYPNQKADYGTTIFQLPSHAQKEKASVSHRVRDLSVMWQCGNLRRERLRSLHIYRWDDPDFLRKLERFVPPAHANTIRQMVALASDPNGPDCIMPERDRLPEDLFTRDMHDWVFVDFETDFNKCIYMMGMMIMGEGYKCEWGTAIHPVSERTLMDRIHSTLTNYKHEGKRLCYFYAEDLFWRERCRFHDLPEYMDLFEGALDLHKVMTHFLFRGVFTFKLKHIANALHNMGAVESVLPEGCGDGAESVMIAREFFQTKSEELENVLTRYNEFDCKILMEILSWVQTIYST